VSRIVRVGTFVPSNAVIVHEEAKANRCVALTLDFMGMPFEFVVKKAN
jgi:hypothetical protein